MCVCTKIFLKILLITLGKQDLVLDLLFRCFIEVDIFIFCLPQILKNYEPTMQKYPTVSWSQKVFISLQESVKCDCQIMCMIFFIVVKYNIYHFNPSEVNNSLSLNPFTVLYKLYHYLYSEPFRHSQQELHAFEIVDLLFPCPHTLVTSLVLLVSVNLPILSTSCKGILKYLSFCV